MKSVKIGLYGNFGHQVQNQLLNTQRAVLKGVVNVPLPKGLDSPAVIKYDSLETMIADPEIDLISLCSDCRRDQAQHAIACLKAGKHVYAEKPCAMTEAELDKIIETAKTNNCLFHEMAGTFFEQPYLTLRELVLSGDIGDIVQVFAQKSYPFHDKRPSDENIDGGLLLQVGVHAVRMVEHGTGLKLRDLQALQTCYANDNRGDLKRAVSMMGELENNGLVSIVTNYLNFNSFPTWGNEAVRIFGTKGFVEAVDGGSRTRLVLADSDEGELEIGRPAPNYFERFLMEIREEAPMPVTLTDEIHPTRMLIKARATSKTLHSQDRETKS
jgi:predicted dehydrogenase